MPGAAGDRHRVPRREQLPEVHTGAVERVSLRLLPVEGPIPEGGAGAGDGGLQPLKPAGSRVIDGLVRPDEDPGAHPGKLLPAGRDRTHPLSIVKEPVPIHPAQSAVGPQPAGLSQRPLQASGPADRQQGELVPRQVLHVPQCAISGSRAVIVAAEADLGTLAQPIAVSHLRKPHRRPPFAPSAV